MEKLTKSMSLFKERNCSVSIVLDSRTRRKNAYEFPLSLRFTIDRKFFYLTVGSSFTEKKFSDICNATKCKSENYKLQKEWKDTFVPKYKDVLSNLNKGGILTFEMVRQRIMSEDVTLSEKEITKSQSFISIWEQVIKGFKTDDGGARFTTAESYECALKSFKKILGTNTIKGFCISAAEIQKWKEGMHNGVKDENGAIVGKISDTTAGIYLRCCRAVWNRCVHEGYLKDVPYPFSNKKEKRLVSIPKSAKRKQSFLNVNQMTELYDLFVSKKYPEHWSEEYTQRAHYSLGLFLAQYLCNGFNMADAGRLTYNSYYYQTNGKAFRFNRKKTSRRSADGSEVVVPIIPPLRYILDEIAAPPTRDGFVFPDILKGAETEELCRKYTMQENSNVKGRVIKICHEALNWDKSICPSGTWCRHSFATNLHNARVDMDYISESMGHSTSDHAITQIYIEHYPLEIQMENNSKLLNLAKTSERDLLLERLASMSTEELTKLFTRT
ncbi:tyrosine-type recombinase/integrase [Paraprevotella clara]|uniref:tyrosine-type recombinase/integrase n=1 Tax=Paraprevotella clara TaxID=454154 RepID=UPI004025C1AF